MKEWTKWLLFALTLIFLAGCGKSGNPNGHYNQVEMTDLEIKLMTKSYFNEDKIEQGLLLDYQLTALNKLRAAMKHAEKRYPNAVDAFDWYGLGPASEMDHTLVVNFGFADEYYTISVTGEEGKYQCRDNFYGYYLRKNYDAALEEILAMDGIRAAAYTNFTEYADLDSQMTFDEFQKGYAQLHRLTHVFVNAVGDHEQTVKRIREAMSSAGISGSSITVWFLPEDYKGKTVEDFMNDKKSSWERESFNLYEANKEANERNDANAKAVAEAFGIDEGDRRVTDIVNVMNSVQLGTFKEAFAVYADTEVCLKIKTEKGSFTLYLTGGLSVEALKNDETGEWLLKSER